MYTGDFSNNSTLGEFFEDAKARYAEDSGEDYPNYLERLHEIAAECDSYLEFGTKQGASAAAVLTGNPSIKEVTLVDITFSGLKGHAGLFSLPNVAKVKGDSTKKGRGLPAKADLVLFDTRHTISQVDMEFVNHGDRIVKYAMVHDTGTFPNLHKISMEHADRLGMSLVEWNREGAGYTLLTAL